ncbi:MAG TPA: hypothetical protein VFW80_03725 [Gaiellaceae bacterium]|nr:hypothetical protein [Gaiellaceae bacterium]
MMRRGLTAVTIACVAAALFSPAGLGATRTQLPFSSYADMIVDGGSGHVFVTGGATASSVAVLDFDGALVTTITGQQGATGMALDEANGTLYVALQNASSISMIDTATLAETGRFATTGMSAPSRLALAGGRVWFSYNCNNSGGVGSAALDGTDLQTELGSASSCNTFATSPTDANALAAADVGGSTVFVYDVSSGSPVLTTSSFSPGGAGNIKQLRYTADGGDILVASGSPYSVQAFSVADFTLSGAYSTGPYPNSVALTDAGDFVAAGADAYYKPDAFVFDTATGTEIRHWDFGANGYTLHPGGLAFSPDASRLFAVTENPATGKTDFRVLGSPTLPPAPTSMALSLSSSKVKYAGSVKLSAKLTGSRGRIAFYASPYLGQKTLLKRVSVDAGGKAAFTAKPTRRTTYTAEFEGDDTHAASTSPGRVVRVHARATVSVSGSYGRSGKYKLFHHGANPQVRGGVKPNQSGSLLKFVAQRYSGGSWHTTTTASFQIQPSGSAYAALYNTSRGKYRVRVVFSGSTINLGDTSGWAYLRVT